MKRHRSFEENPIQNFEIEQEFQQLMQIEGLSQSRGPNQDLFPSLRRLFQSNASVSIIGKGPNANIRAFNYLLLCHIRKVHLKRLLEDRHQEQFDRLDREEGPCRDRKVSFNGRGAVFLNGPQYENYALHKLRIFAFSSSTDLSSIKNAPFEWDSSFKFKGEVLTNSQLKKLLSEFLKELLPSALPVDYKTSLKSVRYYLNLHHVISVILAMVMRHVLFQNYEVQSAGDFQEEVSDHTVCTTLCDAFAIDGLICKDNLYQINTWCKVHSIPVDHSNSTIFVEMFNDEFEELGLVNDQKRGRCHLKKSHTFGVDEDVKEQGGDYPDCLMMPGMAKSEHSVSLQQQASSSLSCRSKEGSGSMMDNDEDSEMASSCPQSERESHCQSERESHCQSERESHSQSERESHSQSERESNKSKGSQIHKEESSEVDRVGAKDQQPLDIVDDGFRSTFNGKTSKVREAIMNQIQQELRINNEQSAKSERAGEDKDTADILFKKKSLCEPQGEKSYLSFRKVQHLPKFGKSSLLSQPTENTVRSGCTSPPVMEKIVLPKPRAKGVSQQEGTRIVNNNISNNIYLSLGEGGQYCPVINISTGKKEPNSININLA